MPYNKVKARSLYHVVMKLCFRNGRTFYNKCYIQMWRMGKEYPERTVSCFLSVTSCTAVKAVNYCHQ